MTKCESNADLHCTEYVLDNCLCIYATVYNWPVQPYPLIDKVPQSYHTFRRTNENRSCPHPFSLACWERRKRRGQRSSKMEDFNKFGEVFAFNPDVAYKQQTVDDILRHRRTLENVLFIDRLLTTLSIDKSEEKIYAGGQKTVTNVSLQHLSCTHLDRHQICELYTNGLCLATLQIITNNQCSTTS